MIRGILSGLKGLNNWKIGQNVKHIQMMKYTNLSKSTENMIDKISKEVEERDIRAKRISDIYKRADITKSCIDISNLRFITDCNDNRHYITHYDIIHSMYKTGSKDKDFKTFWRLVSSCGRNIITGKYEDDATNTKYEPTEYDTPYDLVFKYAEEKFQKEYKESGIKRILLYNQNKLVNTILAIKENHDENNIDIETTSTIIRHAYPSYYGHHDIHRLIETPNIIIDNAKMKHIIDAVMWHTNIRNLRSFNSVMINQRLRYECLDKIPESDDCYNLNNEKFVHKSIMSVISDKIQSSFTGDMSIKYQDTENAIREAINRIGAGKNNYDCMVKYIDHYDDDEKLDITEFMRKYSINPHSLLCMIYNSNTRYKEYSHIKHLYHDDAKILLKELKNDIQFLYDRPIMIKFVKDITKEKQIINKDLIDGFMYKGYIYECLLKLMVANASN